MCKCLTEVNQMLAEKNAILDFDLFSDRVIIGTSKRQSRLRGRPPMMIATFCPFCGEKYPEREPRPPQPQAAEPVKTTLGTVEGFDWATAPKDGSVIEICLPGTTFGEDWLKTRWSAERTRWEPVPPDVGWHIPDMHQYYRFVWRPVIAGREPAG